MGGWLILIAESVKCVSVADTRRIRLQVRPTWLDIHTLAISLRRRPCYLEFNPPGGHCAFHAQYLTQTYAGRCSPVLTISPPGILLISDFLIREVGVGYVISVKLGYHEQLGCCCEDVMTLFMSQFTRHPSGFLLKWMWGVFCLRTFDFLVVMGIFPQHLVNNNTLISNWLVLAS